ncbi:hypothetical protein QAD02_008016 [Eretmocerus hayati]|uniref:Uncharacterized protein n=1 Tax=Eretmocerus hayati TaxID=131215 RepID=A0ACC2N5C2_9HYME|nr:hypothetical protein QAD02_008016 [Eretmocerus hayati]
MGGWSVPPFMPPFMLPHVTPTASIREVRDSESERDQRTTAGRSNDSSGNDAENIRQQRDRLQNLRGRQTTNQVPSNPQAPPIAQTPVGPRIQETSQGAYAGETRQRPREDRREQVRTTLPMHGESKLPGSTQQTQMQEQAPPGIRHSQARDQSTRRDWFSGSSSSDEWEMETPASRRSRSKGKRVVSKEQRKSERIVQVIKTFASWEISFDGEPKGRKDKAEEFLASVKKCMEAIDLSDAEVLAAMPSVLTDRARTWYRTHRRGIATWRDFKQAFRDQYVEHVDHQDLMEELYRRTQGKNELVAPYLTCIRIIVGYFKHPPSEEVVFNIVIRNLRPEIRRYLETKDVRTLAEIQNYGKKFEKQSEWDARYIAPPSQDKSRIPGAAYQGSSSATRKVAATELEEATGQVAGLTIGNKPEAKAPETKPPPATTPANPDNANGGHKGKGRGRRGGKKNEKGTGAGEAAETAAVTTNAKPANTSAPTPSAPPPPTPPTPQAGPWGYPWGFPPYPYWQMPGASGMPRNARPTSAETQEEGRDSGNSSPLTPREDRAPPSIGGPSHHLGAIPRAPMVERRSRDRRRRARPEPIGAEATAPRCPSAAAALAVVTEEPEPALDTGLDPEADSVRAQEELRDWLEPRRTPVRQIPMDPGEFEWPPTPPELQHSSTPPRPATRRDTETSRGTAAGASTPDEFREPALILLRSICPHRNVAT